MELKNKCKQQKAMEIYSTKICRLCLREEANNLTEITQEVQDLFHELTQNKVRNN